MDSVNKKDCKEAERKKIKYRRYLIESFAIFLVFFGIALWVTLGSWNNSLNFLGYISLAIAIITIVIMAGLIQMNWYNDQIADYCEINHLYGKD